ncbi:MAG TPA: peptidoglycan-binding domain-containing protein [Solirubrobacteraceae bacterium]|nr:peptidoglycan-binding domain-containing protein [Solirubrobacteraceae bacterium]
MPMIDGNRVSDEWYAVLSAARNDGVRFVLTDGRRTMTEQWARYNHYKRHGSPIAAFPSPTAPHIRKGRPDHALDINALDGGADRLDAWCTAKGLPLANTVASEAWHKEAASPGALRTFAAHIGEVGRPTATRGTKGAHVRRLQRALAALGIPGAPRASGRFDLATKRAVEQFQRQQGLVVDGIVGAATWAAIERATA